MVRLRSYLLLLSCFLHHDLVATVGGRDELLYGSHVEFVYTRLFTTVNGERVVLDKANPLRPKIPCIQSVTLPLTSGKWRREMANSCLRRSSLSTVENSPAGARNRLSIAGLCSRSHSVVKALRCTCALTASSAQERHENKRLLSLPDATSGSHAPEARTVPVFCAASGLFRAAQGSTWVATRVVVPMLICNAAALQHTAASSTVRRGHPNVEL